MNHLQKLSQDVYYYCYDLEKMIPNDPEPGPVVDVDCLDLL